MKEEILNNLDNPGQLEALYRVNRTQFKKEFNQIYESVQHHTTAQIWNERLNYGGEELSWGSPNELKFVIFVSLMAWGIAKIPDLTGISADFFYPRNISFIVFPWLTIYFFRNQSHQIKQRIAVAVTVILASALFINYLPDNDQSDTLILSCIHLPLILWAVMGIAYAGNNVNSYQKRLDFLQFNGELAVMTGLIVAAFGLFTAITMGLFELIDLDIEEFYGKNILILGLAAAPIVATYLVQTNPQLVNKVSPVIAKIFTPIVLVTLTIYLIAIVYTGKDPYNDREFLLVFNALLIGVMAIILFSIAGSSKNSSTRMAAGVLLALSSVTIILNGIALSAILFRISEWGITPNRLAVFGANSLIFTNLLFIAIGLFKMLTHKTGADQVGNRIAMFLPAYLIWVIIVTFIFPFVFGFH